MLITWSSELNTGIELIDEQHKRIVEYINQLGVAMRRHDYTFVSVVLDELVDYVMSHFAFEESLLEEAHYSLAVPHKAIHCMFIQRIEKCRQQYNLGHGKEVTEKLHSMLKSWLVHHIKREDQAYVPAVKNYLAPTTTVAAEKHSVEGWLTQALGKFFKRA